MEHSYGFEQHVAQQSRRDKLRVPQNYLRVVGELSSNSGEQLGFQNSVHSGLDLDLVRIQSFNKNAILPHDLSSFPAEMINFSRDSNVLSDQRHIMLRQEPEDPAQCSRQILADASLGSFANSLLKASGEIMNNSLGDWVVNCGSNSLGGEMLNEEVTDSTVYSLKPTCIGFQTSTSFNNPSNEAFIQDGQKRVAGELHLPPIYQNSLQGVTSASIGTQDMEMTSIVQHNFTEINQTGSCEGSGNELALLPVYRDQPNVLPYDSTGSWTDRTFYNCRSWTGELGSIARKTGEELRTFMSDSNPQGLSLSLSSNPPSKLPTAQFEESEELQENMTVLKNPQESKSGKSESFCRLPNPTSIGNKNHGKSLQDAMGAPMNTYRNTGPLGPFTGYATILKSSKFLKPAQLLLDEFCGSNGQKFVQPYEVFEKTSGEVGPSAVHSAFRNEVFKENSSCAEASTFCGSNETNVSGVGSISSESHQPEYQQKKAKLLYILEEVCRRYKQYHQQMQMVVSSFESVAGLSSATPYISLALKTVSRHFRCLKNAISEQLKYLRKVLGEDLSSPSAGTSGSKGDANSARLKYMEQSFQKQKSGMVNMGFLESQHVWRPQRGLPERAVAILRAWLFEHFLHPYPTDTDKHMLATQTGLSRNQVSNWFINARVRVWKPMVEEIHMLETKGMAEMNNKSHGTKDGSSTIENTAGWISSEQQPLKNHGVANEIASHHLQCLGVDSSSGDRNGVGSSNQQCDQDKQSKLDRGIQSNMEGELMGFMPYRASPAEVGGLGSVSLTLGLRHRVESAHHQQQHHQLQQQDDQLIRHYGGQMIHDFVG
ncbi:BEL1-like homeodomain protein 8, partial [Cucurbita argyrosperma subsp. argyrosperma]|uniref:BEL1-like homeodomain protein 1 n=1 Tax=Cucurbita moschata TaxID=3662 RepID=A0A6J1GAF8_CUCMO